ncbi:hypothetical protein [Candidatus Pyrohabitans sp.]
MNISRLVLLLLLGVLISGCVQQGEKTEPEKERIIEAREIQSSFEDEYAALKQAIAEGDAEAAKEHYSALLRVYERAKEKAGEQHLRFMVPESDMRRLGEQLNAQDFAGAELVLSNIAGSCGVSVCHQRSGGAMMYMEYEYSEIKGALRKGDIEKAKEHFPEFKRYFFESKEAMVKFLPELTEERMREEYIENLEKALEANDTAHAQEAIKVISENTCALNGCHSIFLMR